VFSNSVGFNVVFLRGVGTDAYLPAADPSVPIYIDDINVLPTQGSIDSLANIERVEILKGPQGTLFGRNALGGAIRIVTATPDDSEFFGNVKVGLGNFNKRTVSAFANVPLAEGLAVSISGFTSEEEPYYTSANDVELFDVYSRGARAALYWIATDTVDLRISGNIQKASSIAGLALEGTRTSIACPCPQDDGPDYVVTNNAEMGSITQNWLVSAQLGVKLPWFSTKLILSDQYLEIPYASTDLDGTAAPALTAFTDAEFGEQRTAELRLESDEDSPWSDRLTWVVGAYYLRSKGGYHPVRFSGGRNLLTVLPQTEPFNDPLFQSLRDLGIELGTGLSFFSFGLLETDSLSGFGQGTWTFLDHFDLTLGLRYDTETRALVDSKLEVQNPVGPSRINLINYDVPDIESSRWSPRIALKWQFADTANVYTSFAIGYLSPTYNSVNLFTAPDLVEQERSDAYELGFKSELFSGLLKLDGAVFYTRRHDIIAAYTTISSGFAVRFYNAGEAEVKGAELGFQAIPLPDLDPGLAIIGSASFLDAKYTDFPEGRGYDEDTGLGFGPGNATGGPRDFSGNRIGNSPRFSGNLAMTQSLPIADDSSIELGVDTYYSSGSYFTPQNSPAAEQKAYQLWNARVTWFYDRWALRVTAHVENLTDEKHLISAHQLDFGTLYMLAPPRTYGTRRSA
jgi:iron complex outermembrane recepter protein